MGMYQIIFSVISLVFYPFLFWFKITNSEDISKIIIPIFVFIMMVNTFVIYLKQVKSKYLLFVFAFFFVLMGDTLINLTIYEKFSPLPFATAHILFSIYYIKECAFKKPEIYLLIPTIIVSALLLRYVFLLTNSIETRVVFTIYLLILSIMVWRGMSYIFNRNFNLKKRICIILGSVLFYTTDVLVGLGFLNNLSIYVILTWLIYPPALFCLSIANWFDE
jgi:hypothetical protein